MSTTLYLFCASHEPVIMSDEVGHNLSYLDAVRKDITRRDHLVGLMRDLEEADLEVDRDFTSSERRNTLWFFRHHPTCELGIRDEYGHDHPIIAPTGETP